MISKNKRKLIRFLGSKKYREEYGLFVAEGDKIVADLLQAEGWQVKYLFAKREWLRKIPPRLREGVEEITEIGYEELRRISYLKSPHNVLALVSLPAWQEPSVPPSGELALALEHIQDPGNLGTIVRTANWFGIRHIYCSPGSADVFNPKVVQASMGAFIHTQVHYTPLETLVSASLKARVPVYGTFLEGTSLYEAGLEDHGLVLFGNESRGISPALGEMIPEKISIPPFPDREQKTNSLNISTSVAITCAEFRRRKNAPGKDHSK